MCPFGIDQKHPMRFARLLCLFLPFAVLLMSCSKDDDPEPDLEPENICVVTANPLSPIIVHLSHNADNHISHAAFFSTNGVNLFPVAGFTIDQRKEDRLQRGVQRSLNQKRDLVYRYNADGLLQDIEASPCEMDCSNDHFIYDEQGRIVYWGRQLEGVKNFSHRFDYRSDSVFVQGYRHQGDSQVMTEQITIMLDDRPNIFEGWKALPLHSNGFTGQLFDLFFRPFLKHNPVYIQRGNITLRNNYVFDQDNWPVQVEQVREELVFGFDTNTTIIDKRFVFGRERCSN